MVNYVPTHGYFDLRKLNASKKDFKKLVNIQKSLIRNDRINRQNDRLPTNEEKELSALLQQVVFNYNDCAMEAVLEED